MKNGPVVIVVGILLLLNGCKVDTSVVDTQRASIEGFLRHDSIVFDSHFAFNTGVYKVVAGRDNANAALLPRAEAGDSVKFRFAVYTFSSSNGFGNLFFTNIQSLVAKDTVLNPRFWSFEPEAVKLGTTRLIRGLDIGLPNTLEGDSIHLFFASNLGYGGKPNGVIAQNSPLAWKIIIDQVIKQSDDE